MKKYTSKILLCTYIAFLLISVIAYTVNFQVKYRKGEITYNMLEKDSLDENAIVIEDEVLIGQDAPESVNDSEQSENE